MNKNRIPLAALRHKWMAGLALLAIVLALCPLPMALAGDEAIELGGGETASEEDDLVVIESNDTPSVDEDNGEGNTTTNIQEPEATQNGEPCEPISANNTSTTTGSTTVLRYTTTYNQTTARSMLSMLNKFRTGNETWWYVDDMRSAKHWQHGLKKLVYDYTLEQTAMVRAREVALLFSHTRPDGTSCFTAFTGTYKYAAENIVVGPTTAKEALQLLKEDEYGYSYQGHRRNMLSSGLNAVGIGHAVIDGVHYWVQDFAYANNPNRTKTTAFDGKKTANTTIYDSSIVSLSSVKASTTSLLIKKSGELVTLPTVKGRDIVITQDDDYTWDTFTAKANVKWKSSNKSVVKVVDGKAKAVASFGETTLKTTALGKTIKVKVYVGLLGDVSKLNVKISNKKYSGSAITPQPTLKLNGRTLKLGTDYKLSYKNNKKVGKATLVITGIGHYIGTKNVYFNIVE